MKTVNMAAIMVATNTKKVKFPRNRPVAKDMVTFLPVNAEVKAPVYYDSVPKDNVYRENVGAYAAKSAPHQVIASPVSYSHYSIVDPKTKNHQYFTLEEPKPHYKRPLLVNPKASYILEEDPHYVDPGHKIVVKPPPVISHAPHYQYPAKDYSLNNDHHFLDKSHHSSGHGHYGDNSIHGESGHKAHKKHEVSGHKAHSSVGKHHDEHIHHHDRGHYERDRGYHYEKAYAYDRVRAHHDIGSNKGSHSDYKSQHSQEGHTGLGKPRWATRTPTSRSMDSRVSMAIRTRTLCTKEAITAGVKDTTIMSLNISRPITMLTENN
ncbi:uncharacterized protein CEXT_606441 [Caerostris extrusa]|uniref:Uncharacterized protein n=1 Tax=Caerostris extrusa TaxID=172846 RepID=A0AAV4N9U5_CAEEX|nr:uncharacterized protein CEXT_606441 [Caerostris extrusa]